MARDPERAEWTIAVAFGAAAVVAVTLPFIPWPGALMPVPFAMMGFAAGIANPSRDLLIRRASPPGATGRVYGVVYSGLDLGMSMQSSYTHGLSLIPEAARPTFDDAMPFPQRYFTVLAMLQKMGLAWQLQYASEASKRTMEAKVAGRDLGKNRDMATKIFGGHPGSYFNDLIPSTAQVKVPVLVIDGQDDRAVGPQAERFAYPTMTRVTLPGRHNPFIDAPDTYRDAVHAFVKKHRLR